MPITTPEEILVLRDPSYDGDPRLTDYIALAEQRTGQAFCDDYNLAVALRALHMLTLADERASSGGGTTIGSLKSEKEGDLQRQYTGGSLVVAQKYPDLTQTIWGQELIELMSTLILPRNSVIIDGCT